MDSHATVLVRKLYSTRWAAYLPWIICGLAAFFYFYELCLRVALGTMVPEVQASLKISLGELGILSAFYYYAYTPMQVVAGALIDRIGPRRLLIIMVLLCAMGSYLFASTSHFIVAVGGQFIIGFASAFAFVGVMKLASNWLPANYFGLIVGLTTSLGMVGAMISNVFIVHLMHGIGWRGVWYVFAFFGITLMVVIYLLCVNRPRNSEITRPHALRWKNIKNDFVSMVRCPFFWVNGVIGGLLYFPTTSFASLWGIPYLQTAYGFDKLNASMIVSMIFLGWAVGGPLVGWLSDRFVSKRNFLIYGSLFSLLLGCVVLSPLKINAVMYAFLLFLFGVTSSVEILVFDVAAKLFNGRSAGTAASLTNFILMLVSALLQPVIGFIISNNPTAHEYRCALLIIPVGLFLAFILSTFVYRDEVAVKKFY